MDENYGSRRRRLTVKIVNKSGMPLPAYATTEAAGLDVHAFLKEDVTIPPLGRALIPTGLKMQIPRGFECQIRPRSGLALKHGITVLNTPGTIDADSRGEIGVILMNLSNEPFVVRHGDRICQMVFKACERVEWQEVRRIDHTQREKGAFGDSGVSEAAPFEQKS